MRFLTHEQFLSALPRIADGFYEETSDYDPVYNCIAWAADDTEQRWWPSGRPSDFWPPDAPLEETLDAFIAAYGTRGYIPCDDSTLEEGFEKIALYGRVLTGRVSPTHAARQLPNGHWTSKLGDHEDVEHETPERVECPTYGVVVGFMKRKTLSAVRTEIVRLLRAKSGCH